MENSQLSTYIQQFNAVKASVDAFLLSMKLPVSTAKDENDIYSNVCLLRNNRNTLFNFGVKMRKIKRILSAEFDSQKDLEAKAVAAFLAVDSNLKGLKTKDERDFVIRAHILEFRASSGSLNLEPIINEIDAVLLDINIAIQEMQKTFDEYSLIYNFERLVSTGNLLSMSRHSLDCIADK